MKLEIILKEALVKFVESNYDQKVDDKLLALQKTRKEFEGDLTLVVFPLLRMSKKNPEQTATEIGEYLKSSLDIVSGYNVVKGFLNVEISDKYWLEFFNEMSSKSDFGLIQEDEKLDNVVIEYSSPNTNKPLHLGHIRNNLLGYATAQILKANGNKVAKVNLVNDRGIHICKSMLAWQKFGKGETPQSTNKKGDHLVGEYYVKFDKEYKKEIVERIEKGESEDDAKNNANILLEAREMLLKWEAKDKEVYDLWSEMNSWVYAGFDTTYKTMGVDFDKIYYESETYLLGKKIVLEGLEKGVFYKKEDGSVWCDLTEDGLDQKILLRADGTSVYMTQDIGTALLRYADYKMNRMIYVVGNEQDYHFRVLSLILSKLGYDWAKNIYHQSYGMVELPEGKMKSREGTVVDADDLMAEMIKTAKEMSEELGKLEEYSSEEKEEIYRIIGLGALKYFILKVDPKKSMTFNPQESIDFNGNTGPFIQYTYARVRSLIRKADEQMLQYKDVSIDSIKLNAKERAIIKNIYDFPQVIADAGTNYSPALIANYLYDFVKEFNQFYHDYSVFNEEKENVRLFRLNLSLKVSEIVKTGMGLLGIEVPERM